MGTWQPPCICLLSARSALTQLLVSAQASGAPIVGFNVRPNAKARDLVAGWIDSFDRWDRLAWRPDILAARQHYEEVSRESQLWLWVEKCFESDALAPGLSITEAVERATAMATAVAAAAT